jgi:hypothetical protein
MGSNNSDPGVAREFQFSMVGTIFRSFLVVQRFRRRIEL